MTTKHYRELVIDDGAPSLYGDLLTVPKDCVFWRGYDVNYPIISDKPAFFGSKETARAYAKPELGCFTNKKELKLMDVKFMKVILRQLLDEIKVNREYGIDKDPVLKEETLCIDCITVSFGLCSLAHQIDIMDKIYKDVPNFEGLQKMKDYYNSMKYTTIEQGGFRVGETKVDEVTMYILRDFFKDYADGFFSRTLPSPFHFEEGGMLHPEIIIFNPIECGIELLNEAPYAVGALNDGLIMMQFVNNQLPGMEGLNDASSMMDTLDITDLVSSKRKVALIRSVYNMPKIKKENVKYKSPSNEDFIIQLQNEDNKTVSIEKIGEKYGKLWRTKYFYLGETGPAKPTCNITGYLMRLRKIQEP